MNPKIKAQWLIDLRSGEYKQGYGELKAVKAGEAFHCCLGVLCEQAAKAGIVIEEDGAFRAPGKGEYLHDSALLPPAVSTWSGVSRCGELETAVDYHLELTDLNDSKMYTFEDIANIIEKQF